jgi:hypothetical protein
MFLLNVQHAFKKNCILILSRNESVIQKHITILHSVLLHDTTVEGYPLQDFQLHFFHKTYFEAALPMNTLCSTAHISQAH